MRELEADYARMRWTGSRMRALYYGPLWKARRMAMDPLEAQVREAGRAEEKRLLDALSDRSRIYEDAANGFYNRVGSLMNFHLNYAPCCVERAYTDCLNEALKPFYGVLLEMKAYAAHVLESEKDYLLAVSSTAGGPQGLYPEDAVEKETEHTGYYARFEMERESGRFEEDARMGNFFERATRILTADFAGKNCCLACRPLDAPHS